MNRAVKQSRQPLDVPALRRRLLAPEGPLNRLEWLAVTGSTNTVMAENASGSAAAWPELSLLLAEEQRQGRGRMDRCWQVPTGGALTLSLLLRPAGIPVESFGWLSMMSAVAICQTLNHRAGLQAQLKWPNDVVVTDAEGTVKKISGVLAQLVLAIGEAPAIVVGSGVNISQLADELPTATATSVLVAGGTTLDRNILIEDYVHRFHALYRRFLAVDGQAQRRPSEGEPSVLEEVSELLISLGQHVRAELPGGKFLYGTATGLNASGALLVTDAQGSTTAVSAADVVHLRKAEGSYA
ncbi:biotin--[acetyl-CoA-carboxylase] ligase [Psychromicrobium sp. YIM B11713]|uniref:biotin--[acetyl-CoA-carboxylase] ligase n=1 Tax=Psychromicrobium sp. YIM B11713 TaxID=3145233 RepID=UPI00374FC871